MSKLVHMCPTCGHQQQHHDPARRAFIGCSCCATHEPSADIFDAEPTIVETFAYPSGELEPLFEPGSTRNAHSPAHREQLCGCTLCRAAYAAQAG
jgi:ssDNA-binding Zn-finger/Zn-ribbon topoisomerase 1